MKQLGLQALFRDETSPEAGKRKWVYPYLLDKRPPEKTQRLLVRGHHLHPHAKRVSLPDGPRGRGFAEGDGWNIDTILRYRFGTGSTFHGLKIRPQAEK
jgi:hypothetical protein